MYVTTVVRGTGLKHRKSSVGGEGGRTIDIPLHVFFQCPLTVVPTTEALATYSHERDYKTNQRINIGEKVLCCVTNKYVVSPSSIMGDFVHMGGLMIDIERPLSLSSTFAYRGSLHRRKSADSHFIGFGYIGRLFKCGEGER